MIRIQEGTFRERPADARGRYGYQFFYTDADGRGRGPIFRAGTKEAALRKAQREARRILGALEAGRYIAPERGRQKFASCWADYLARTSTTRPLSPATLAEWERIWKKHIESVVGHVPIGRIRRSHIRTVLDGIAARRTRGQALALMRTVLNRALDDEEIQVNPAARWRLTSAELGEVSDFEPATPAEIDRIADAIASRFRALVYVLAYGALRFSEAVALRRDDVDEINRRIRIDERLLEVSSTGRLHFGEPKTSKSRAWVPLPGFVVEELVVHLDTFVARGDPRALIFTGARGGPVRRSNFVDRAWKDALDAAGLTGRFSPMQLRHAGGSLAHEAGASERDVAELLRHTSTRMASRYVRVYEDRRRRIADAMEELARPKPGAVRRLKRA